METIKNANDKRFEDKPNHGHHGGSSTASFHPLNSLKKPKRTKTLSLNPAECEALENLIEDVIIDGMDEGAADTDEETSDEDGEFENASINGNVILREGDELELSKASELDGQEQEGKVYPPQLKVAVKHMKNLPPRFLKKIHSTKDGDTIQEGRSGDEPRAMAISDRNKASRSREVSKKEQKMKIRGLLGELDQYIDEVGSPEQTVFLQTITEGQALMPQGQMTVIVTDAAVSNSTPSPNRNSVTQFAPVPAQGFLPYSSGSVGQPMSTVQFTPVPFLTPQSGELVQNHQLSPSQPVALAKPMMSCQELEAELINSTSVGIVPSARLPVVEPPQLISAFSELSPRTVADMPMLNGLMTQQQIQAPLGLAMVDSPLPDWRSQISAEAPEFVPRAFAPPSISIVPNMGYMSITDHMLSSPAGFAPHPVSMSPMMRSVTLPEPLPPHHLPPMSSMPLPPPGMAMPQPPPGPPPPPMLGVPQPPTLGHGALHAPTPSFMIPKMQTNMPPPPLPPPITNPSNGLGIMTYPPMQYPSFSPYPYPGPMAPIRQYLGSVHASPMPYALDNKQATIPPPAKNSLVRPAGGYYRVEPKSYRDYTASPSSYRTPVQPTVPRKPAEINVVPIATRLKTHLDANQKVMVLMRGCPGSGKSTLAREIVGDGAIFSTDEYFIKDGVYQYEYQLLAEAHLWNQRRAKEALAAGKNPVIIDNTNLQAWEMKVYVAAALEHSYVVEIAEPTTEWRYKARELAQRNIHGVTLETIHKMLDRFERNIAVETLLESFEGRKTEEERRKVVEEDMKVQEEAWKKPVRRRRKRRRRRHRSGKAANAFMSAFSVISGAAPSPKDGGDDDGSSDDDDDSGLDEASDDKIGIPNWDDVSVAMRDRTADASDFDISVNNSPVVANEENLTAQGRVLSSSNIGSELQRLDLSNAEGQNLVFTESAIAAAKHGVEELSVATAANDSTEVKRDTATTIESCDFTQKALSGISGQFPREIRTVAREITAGMTLPARSQRPPQRLQLDKSSWTADDFECNESNDDNGDPLTTLQACFPTVDRDSLEDILLHCGHDLSWAVNTLLDSGYEYNEPVATKAKTSSSDKISSQNQAGDIKLLQDLCRLAVVGDMNIAGSDLEKMLIDSCASRTAAIEQHLNKRCAAASSTQKQGNDRVTLDASPGKKGFSASNQTELTAEEEDTIAWAELLERSSVAKASVPNDTCHQLKLDENLAVKLTEMFGPVGVGLPPEFLNADDLTAALSRQTLAAIYRDWTRFVEHRLAEEETFFAGLCEDGETTNNACYNPQSSLGSKASAPPLKFVEIMDEELAREMSLSELAEVSSRGSEVDLATRLKNERQLQTAFPSLSTDIIRKALATNRHSLDATTTALRSMTVTPINSAQTSVGAKAKAGGGDENVTALRRRAAVLYQLRRDCYAQAHKAHADKQGGVAAYYCQKGREYSAQLQVIKERTIDRLFVTRFAELEGRDIVLDLHGMRVDEAVRVTLDALAIADSDQGEGRKRRRIVVITGHGSHSIGGVARLRPAVITALTTAQYDFEEVRPGVITVKCVRR